MSSKYGSYTSDSNASKKYKEWKKIKETKSKIKNPFEEDEEEDVDTSFVDFVNSVAASANKAKTTVDKLTEDKNLERFLNLPIERRFNMLLKAYVAENGIDATPEAICKNIYHDNLCVIELINEDDYNKDYYEEVDKASTLLSSTQVDDFGDCDGSI